jgi:hypothetical protein
LKYLSEATPPPAPAAKIKPKSPEAKGKTPAPNPQPVKTGPVIAPIVVAKPMSMSYVLRRVSAICGSGDATISIASFGGTVRLKKI